MHGLKPKEILPNLFFIERGYLNANHFVFRGDSPVLIDTGYLAGFDETVFQIERLGISPADIGLIVNTHSHCDHIGGNRRLQDMSGCDVAIHRIGKGFMDLRDDWSTWWRYYDQEAEFFTATIPLDDGDRISIGPYEFEVIHTPGHASDGIVLYHRESRILISSDTLWENDMAVMTVRVEGSRAVWEMIASLEKIHTLDVEAVYPGHGRPFTDFQAAVDRARQRLRGFLNEPERIGNDLLKKIIIYTLMMRPKVLAERFFSNLMNTHWFKETVDLYFDGRYEAKYEEILHQLTKRILVKEKGGCLTTTVKP